MIPIHQPSYAAGMSAQGIAHLGRALGRACSVETRTTTIKLRLTLSEDLQRPLFTAAIVPC